MTRATPFAVVVASDRMQYVFIASQFVGSGELARTSASMSASASLPMRPPSSTAKAVKPLSGLPERTTSRCLPIFLCAAVAAAAPSTAAASPVVVADLEVWSADAGARARHWSSQPKRG